MKILVLFFCLFLSQKSYAILSPWYQAYNEIKIAFEKDACFEVLEPILDQPTKTWLIVVNACSKEKASAWETIIATGYKTQSATVLFKFHNITATSTAILGSSREIRLQSLIDVFKTAFQDNSFYNKVYNTDCIVQGCFYRFPITLELNPQVIQIFVDDLNDFHGQRNVTAQDHFSKIVSQKINEFSIGFTTSLKH